MTNQDISWPGIFALFREPAGLSDWELAKKIAGRLGIPDPRSVRDWIQRGAIPMHHWESLIILLERDFNLIVSERQLVRATMAASRRRKAAANEEAA